MSWQEVIKEFKGKNKQEGLGSAACLVLMYLAFGQCWAYKMANEFTLGLIPDNGWKEEQLKY